MRGLTQNEKEQHRMQCATLMARCMQLYYEQEGIALEGNEDLSFSIILHLLKKVIEANIEHMNLKISKKEFIDMNIELITESLREIPAYYER